MRTLIIGAGQVGSALFDVLQGHHEVYIRDMEDLKVDDVHVLHICYPDHAGFELTTKRYIDQYKPILTVINSSVSVGATQKCGSHVVYSPVRGRHPKLSNDLKLYTKFVFSTDKEDLDLASQHFEEAGIDTYKSSDVMAGELLKLISNVHMGLEIAWRQEVERMLNALKLSPQVYDEWERTYQQGYICSGDNHLIRPIMRPDPIGGHCILPCVDILKKSFESKLFDFIIESNDRVKGENS